MAESWLGTGWVSVSRALGGTSFPVASTSPPNAGALESRVQAIEATLLPEVGSSKKRTLQEYPCAVQTATLYSKLWKRGCQPGTYLEYAQKITLRDTNWDKRRSKMPTMENNCHTLDAIWINPSRNPVSYNLEVSPFV